ncbi:MAG: hypothetical protein GAK45_01262 [Pseudomonas citronellolis]|nr:MAG: hypothetical protein GAK45_01262 [Pseudomonas citronellolis]
MLIALIPTIILVLLLWLRRRTRPARPASVPLALPAPASASPPLRREPPDNLVRLPLGLHPAERCLQAPISISGVLRVRPPLQFWSLSADEIRFGDSAGAPPGVSVAPPGERLQVVGDWLLTEGSCLEADLQVAGDLRLEANACLHGSAQVEGSVWLAEGAEVEGAIIARGSVRIGRHARVAGPLLASRSISLACECVIGSPELPTRVNARALWITEGCRIHGQVSAEEGARVKCALPPLSLGRQRQP